jgi:hypothetical protein
VLRFAAANDPTVLARVKKRSYKHMGSSLATLLLLLASLCSRSTPQVRVAVMYADVVDKLMSFGIRIFNSVTTYCAPFCLSLTIEFLSTF